jgi:hypothetical protein
MPCGSRLAMGDVPVLWAGCRSTGGLFSGPFASSLAVRSVRHPPRRSCSETEILPSITLATHTARAPIGSSAWPGSPTRWSGSSASWPASCSTPRSAMPNSDAPSTGGLPLVSVLMIVGPHSSVSHVSSSDSRLEPRGHRAVLDLLPVEANPMMIVANAIKHRFEK